MTPPITPAQIALAKALAHLDPRWDGDYLHFERTPGNVLILAFSSPATLEGLRHVSVAHSHPGGAPMLDPEHTRWCAEVEARVQIEADRIRHARQAGA